MNKTTFSFLVAVSICICVMLVALVIYNEANMRQIIQERNESCFQLGLGMTEVMQQNGSVIVESCNCYFGAIRDGDYVTECVCDCVIPGIPFTSCIGLEGCYAENYECRCRYGIILNPEA